MVGRNVVKNSMDAQHTSESGRDAECGVCISADAPELRSEFLFGHSTSFRAGFDSRTMAEAGAASSRSGGGVLR